MKVAPGESGLLAQVVPEERERLQPLAAAFSHEDLLRIFEVLTKVETDLRLAQDPRVTLELALMKAAQLQRLMPFAELVERVERLAGGRAAARARGRPAHAAAASTAAPAPPPPPVVARCRPGAEPRRASRLRLRRRRRPSPAARRGGRAGPRPDVSGRHPGRHAGPRPVAAVAGPAAAHRQRRARSRASLVIEFPPDFGALAALQPGRVPGPRAEGLGPRRLKLRHRDRRGRAGRRPPPPPRPPRKRQRVMDEASREPARPGSAGPFQRQGRGREGGQA